MQSGPMGRAWSNNDMMPWSKLNIKGKILIVCCCLNMWLAVVIALSGDWSCIISVVVAATCGICTFKKRYQHQDADDINKFK